MDELQAVHFVLFAVYSLVISYFDGYDSADLTITLIPWEDSTSFIFEFPENCLPLDLTRLENDIIIQRIAKKLEYHKKSNLHVIEVAL